MNRLFLEYKRETGLNHKIGFECSRYKKHILNVEISIIDVFDDSKNVIEFHTPEYVKWLEEKIEQLEQIK